jgi:hypothetical protein
MFRSKRGNNSPDNEGDLLTSVQATLRKLGKISALKVSSNDSEGLKAFLSLVKTYGDLWEEQSELFEKIEELEYEGRSKEKPKAVEKLVKNLRKQKQVLTECAVARGKLSDSDKNRCIEILPDDDIDKMIKDADLILDDLTRLK